MSDLDDLVKLDVPLAAMIQTLRRELRVAVAERDADDPPLRVDKVVLDLAIDVQETRSAEGGASVWVLSASGSTSASTKTAHRFQVTLVPDGAGDLVVRDETRLIRG